MSGKQMKRKIKEILKRPYEIRLVPDKTGGFFVYVAEWPGCMSQGETAEEAVAMIREAMELWAETALEMGKEVPAPFAEERYSGKFVVRLPRSLHRRLAERARQEGVSLNALVVSFVSEGLGGKSLGSEPSLRLEPPAGLWRAEDLPHTAVAAGRGPSYVA